MTAQPVNCSVIEKVKTMGAIVVHDLGSYEALHCQIELNFHQSKMDCVRLRCTLISSNYLLSSSAIHCHLQLELYIVRLMLMDVQLSVTKNSLT